MKTYENLKVEFKKWLDENKDVQRLWELNAQGDADYILADAYAKGISRKWSQLLTDAYGSELSDYIEANGWEGSINEISDEIAKAYRKAYSESAYYSKNVQKGINNKLKIGMSAIEPKIDEERIENLVEKLRDVETTEEMRRHLLTDSALQPVTRSAVADTIRANARIQSDAGLHAYVERNAGTGCCAWCTSMAGRYEFGAQPKDFFAVHDGCICTIDYKPSRYARMERLSYNASLNKFT